MKLRHITRQAGFTLVEIAIVLVIIGVLLVGVLQGQEMVQNAKIKSGIAGMNGIGTAFNGYVDRYNRIPGDDTTVGTARGANWTNVDPGFGNGILNIPAANTFIASTATASTATIETPALWGQLRASGFVETGDMSTAPLTRASPKNPWGGSYGIFAETTATATVINNIPSTYKVCMSRVPGAAARAIDAQLDNGTPNTGAVRAIGVVSSAADTAPVTSSTAYNEDQYYTICKKM